MRRSVFIAGILLFLCALPVFAETEAERKARLERELQNVEKQILEQQVLVEDKQLERRSLERDLSLLETQISKAKLGIQARSVAIAQLEDQIENKEGVIIELNRRLEKHRQSLGQLI